MEDVGSPEETAESVSDTERGSRKVTIGNKVLHFSEYIARWSGMV